MKDTNVKRFMNGNEDDEYVDIIQKSETRKLCMRRFVIYKSGIIKLKVTHN